MSGMLKRNEVTIVRTLDAPRDLVWAVWTDPKHLTRWWGPHGFTNTICDVDARPGGALHISMRPSEEIRVGMGLPEGAEFAMRGVYQDVTPPSKLSFTNNALGLDGSEQLKGFTTVIFEDVGGRTRVTMTSSAEGEGPIAEAMMGGMEQGWSETADRMVDYVKGAQ